MKEASNRGSFHFHTVLLDRAALPGAIQGRDASTNDQGGHIITKALALMKRGLMTHKGIRFRPQKSKLKGVCNRDHQGTRWTMYA